MSSGFFYYHPSDRALGFGGAWGERCVCVKGNPHDFHVDKQQHVEY